MTLRIAVVLLAAVVSGAVLRAAEPSIELQFRDGRVWITATDVPVRVILREWARLGGTTIVNGDVVDGPPVTLQLTGVSEDKALDSVLRDTAGYVAVRRAVGANGLSGLKRIVILPMPSVVGAPAAPAGPRFEKAEDREKDDLPEPPDAAVRGLPEPLADTIRTIRDSMPPELRSH